MTTVCMQTVVSSKTVQVVLLAEQATAKIYMVNSDGSSQQPRAMSVREYLDAGMSSEQVVRHILEVITTALGELDRLRKDGL
ncbi:hypothetical protein LGN04_05870 [Burkholderia multivorans]|uniref:Uncharacterized protein n=1 Tax=Burkholderia multivorans TaxID=87883 RepID=A0A8E2RZF5_9BURK|nr:MULTISPECIES: hypothetical protein [Burkholderia cepacia complex]AIO47869.1 hypothetical protein DM42_1868 [Burkholderia cepacia]PFW68813.1 hypothetical protein COL27_28735 [Bacillus sp. AFS075960]AIO76171.1 hypothetical protein DM80_1766 [Burkholderia multivorans]KHS11407.1 hypothetical protein BMD20_20810 [Burkholderia multivorans]KHS18437.1 hypothetical protein BMD22_11010 [Burkholderia multivorans]